MQNHSLLSLKNQWLCDFISQSPYPTEQSLAGMHSYQATQSSLSVQQLSSENCSADDQLNFYCVSDNRTMIQFVKLYQLSWPEALRANIIEFLTQMDLSQPANDVQLYFVTKSGQGYGTAMVTENATQRLLSDIFCVDTKAKASFIAQLNHYLSHAHDKESWIAQ
ncbi:hypothetical protein VST7929_02802 [Vibrio stylophorae]|uniref:Uncharacterized protein n=1 Tax=Vibrio stylophorae TaxID=659351 RepID=A0ABN8DY35_9VIBR|nr:hypothetical protein [Vibrio stylophorae]CAH0535141.1 hypothetical protein VST7929_02802 [Vibrio stylophorae]